MDSVKRFATFIYIIVSVLSGCGHCQVVIQGPSNTTVLVGSQARFNCTVEGPWITIFWFMKRTPILTVSSDQGVTTPHKRFSAVNYTRASSFTSELIISDVRISDTGTIECNIFSSEFFTAYLSVEVNSNSLDQRDVIIIAVTVSIGGLLLIILIILLIIFCCRRRKKEESSYQSQLKKVSAQRANNVSTISKSSAMKADLGDHEEEPATRRPLPKTPSEASSISNSFGAEQNLGRYTTHVRGLNNGAFYPGYDSTNPQKVRHLTHV
ncbi:immunoglobulin superfamily member 5 isoform X2 [Lissotriton helveticus]